MCSARLFDIGQLIRKVPGGAGEVWLPTLPLLIVLCLMWGLSPRFVMGMSGEVSDVA